MMNQAQGKTPMNSWIISSSVLNENTALAVLGWHICSYFQMILGILEYSVGYLLPHAYV